MCHHTQARARTVVVERWYFVYVCFVFANNYYLIIFSSFLVFQNTNIATGFQLRKKISRNILRFRHTLPPHVYLNLVRCDCAYNKWVLYTTFSRAITSFLRHRQKRKGIKTTSRSEVVIEFVRVERIQFNIY